MVKLKISWVVSRPRTSSVSARISRLPLPVFICPTGQICAHPRFSPFDQHRVGVGDLQEAHGQVLEHFNLSLINSALTPNANRTTLTGDTRHS